MAKLKRLCTSIRHGVIQFEIDADDELAIYQGWNPSSLNAKWRAAIAKELRHIADQMDLDHFENNGKFQHYPIT